MIKEHVNVSELRTNNYVLIWGRPIQICGTQVLKHVAKVFTYNGLAILEYGCQEVFPIPLTPEWLERMGFVWDESRYDGETRIVRKGCLELHHDEDQPKTGSSIALFDDGNIAFAGHDIRYVHQLQNLYFALTREELQIKL